MKKTTLCHTVFLGLILLVLPGCATLSALSASVLKPSAKIQGVKIQGLSMESALLVLDVEVDNPYPVKMPVRALEYQIASGEKAFLSGAMKEPPTIPAKSSVSVQLPAKVEFLEVLKVVQGIRPGVILPYRVDMSVATEALGYSPVTLPLRREGQLPIPAPPKMEIADFHVEKFSFNQVLTRMKLIIENHNEFPMTLSEFDYNFAVGEKVVASGKLKKPMKLKPGEPGILDTPIAFSPKNVGSVSASLLSGAQTPFSLTGITAFETPFGPLRFGYKQVGDESFKR